MTAVLTGKTVRRGKGEDMAKRQITVTRRQVELAQAKVEADRALHRDPDPVLVRVAAAGDRSSTGR